MALRTIVAWWRNQKPTQGVDNSSKPFQILEGELLLQLMTIARLVSLLLREQKLRVGCRENGIALRTIVAWQRNQKQTQEVDYSFQAFQIQKMVKAAAEAAAIAAAIMLLLLRRRAIYFCIAEDLYNHWSSQLVVKSRERSNQHCIFCSKH